MAITVFQMVGDNPIGVSNLSGDSAPAGTLGCTQAQADEFLSSSAYFHGSSDLRWEYISDVLTELTDSRPRVTWADTSGQGNEDPQGDWTFNLEVGDTPPVVTASLPGSATINHLVTCSPSNQKIKFSFVGGVVSMNIETDKPTHYKIVFGDNVRFANELTVNVRAVNLYVP